MKKIALVILATGMAFTSCKKKGCTDQAASNYNSEAKKDDGTCVYDDPELEIPSTYAFKDADGNNTVSYGGQTDRLNQLEEMTTYMKSGTGAEISADVLKDMFANTDDNGAGNFSFSSSKQLKNKCFETDVDMFEGWMEDLALASADFATTAESGQAGTLTTGEKTYLVGPTGIEYTQLIEKGLMGAVFFYQASQKYFGSEKMDVDNTTPEDPAEGKYYTQMEHHWDEAFGYFGVSVDFPANTDDIRFWGKYCNKQDAALGCNATIMDAFIKGRAVISQGFDLSIRDEQITIIRKECERFCASQAVTYLEGAKDNFGTDNAKFLHELSEAYAFILSLKYAPLETRVINYSEITALLNDTIGTDFWAVTTADLTSAINTINSIYGF